MKVSEWFKWLIDKIKVIIDKIWKLLKCPW